MEGRIPTENEMIVGEGSWPCLWIWACQAQILELFITDSMSFWTLHGEVCMKTLVLAMTVFPFLVIDFPVCNYRGHFILRWLISTSFSS